MANGDVFLTTTRQMSALLLDAADGTQLNNGAWVDCGAYAIGAVSVDGVATLAVITIYGSSAVNKPSNATNTGTISVTGNPTTAATNPTVPIPALPRWIKAGITTVGTGTVTVTFTGRVA